MSSPGASWTLRNSEWRLGVPSARGIQLYDSKIAHLVEQELKSAIQGEVRFDDGSRALYATDGSNYRQVPIGVVIPKSIQDVEVAMAICHKYDVPFLSRGGGTSLCGPCCNVAVVLVFWKYLGGVIGVDGER
jgi:FAD/FMN-containing dehydrogenase